MVFRFGRASVLLCLSGLALTGAAGPALAQEPLPASEFRIELSGGAGSDRFTGAVSLSRHVALALNRRLRLGFGMRYSVFGGSDLRFRTADREELDGNPTDHAEIANPRIHAVNLAGHLSLRVWQPLELGFNIDVIGVGFGPERVLDQEQAGEPTRTGSPAGFNLLRGGVRDRGTLDSEFYAGWQVTRRLIVRAGVSHYVAEFRSDAALAGGSTRIRVDGNLWFASAGYRF